VVHQIEVSENYVNVNQHPENTIVRLVENILSAPGDRGIDRALVLVAARASHTTISNLIFETIVCE
jgi:hypothetical protein